TATPGLFTPSTTPPRSIQAPARARIRVSNRQYKIERPFNPVFPARPACFLLQWCYPDAFTTGGLFSAPRGQPMRLDHIVIHVDNDEPILQDLKRTLNAQGYPFDPNRGRRSPGVRVSNINI